MVYSSQKEGVGMAFGKRCSLCGGKLNSEKRCTECGLDNTKNDDMYKGMMNRNNCDDMPLTHVHEEPIKQTVGRKSQYQSPDYAAKFKSIQSKAATYSGSKHTSAKTKNAELAKKSAKIISTLVVILGVIPSIFGMITELVEEDTYYEEEPVYSEPVYEDYYAYDSYLNSGFHTVGVHIPQGTYSVELDGGDCGTISVLEYVDGNVFSNEFYTLERNETEYVEDIYLYEGEVLMISSEITVRVYSDDAYYDCIGTENTLVDLYTITDEAVAGVDFPVGFYDIYYTSSEEEYGSVLYTILGNDGKTIWISSEQYFGSDVGDVWYGNVPFTAGSTIRVQDLQEITLVPSTWVDPSMDFAQETEEAVEDL